MNLFAHERQGEILKILQQEGKIVVKELSTRFQVTEDCIRKDLTLLENQQLLQKTYGGAVPYRTEASHDKVSKKLYIQQEEKQIIADKAFSLIGDQETIFLDISSTNILLAEKLAKSKKHLLVMTNMLDIICLLNQSENNINVICTGGMLNKYINSFTGSVAAENISHYKFNKSFIGSAGIDVMDKSITTIDIEDGATKKAIIKNSRAVYLVVENSKFYSDGTYKFAQLHDIDTIITDSLPDKEILAALAKCGTAIL